MPFGVYVATWLNQRSLRPHTPATYESQLRHILARFEHVELSSITPADVRPWHGRLVNSDLNRNTVAKVYRRFRTILGTAFEDGLLRANPISRFGVAVSAASSPSAPPRRLCLRYLSRRT